MFGFGKKKGAEQQFSHETRRSDWEVVLDQIYLEAVLNFQNGIAVISNTTRSNSNDTQGNLSMSLTLRVKDSVESPIKDLLRAFKKPDFDKLFAKLAEAEPAERDCYVVKNMGLPNNALIFPIQGLLGRQAFVVFGGQYLKNKLQEKLDRIQTTLKGKTGSQSPGSGEAVEAKAPPKPILFKNITRTDIRVINERLDYLENKESLKKEEEAEKHHLSEFLQNNFKKSMS